MEVRLPQLAEGADSGTVVKILVSEGDTVEKDQALLELENQKAVAPIPSPAAGRVARVHIREGETVGTGQVLVTLTQEGTEARPQEKDEQRKEQPSGRREPRQTPDRKAPHRPSPGVPPPASPSIRKLARELGVDLSKVSGRGPGGRISMEDLRAYIQSLQSRREGERPCVEVRPQAPAPSVDFSKWGPVEKKPFSPLRRAIAQAMTHAWLRIPHVTQFGEADVSRILAFKKEQEGKGQKSPLTLTAFLIKALVPVLKKYPVFNASLDEAAGQIVFKQYIHIGIAVDTEAGLIVPVLRDADKKSLAQIAEALRDLAEKTRSRKISARDLQGGTFTLSNQGGIGGSHFTPIIHHPEAAILGVGRAARKMLPLALSYDHRLIDGADAARFITALTGQIENFPRKEVQ